MHTHSHSQADIFKSIVEQHISSSGIYPDTINQEPGTIAKIYLAHVDYTRYYCCYTYYITFYCTTCYQYQIPHYVNTKHTHTYTHRQDIAQIAAKKSKWKLSRTNSTQFAILCSYQITIFGFPRKAVTHHLSDTGRVSTIHAHTGTYKTRAHPERLAILNVNLVFQTRNVERMEKNSIFALQLFDLTLKL